MKGITGFRLREGRQKARDTSVLTLPEPHFDRDAQARVMAKIDTLGEDFYTMSEDRYGDWLDSLPRDEFIEFIAVMIELDERSRLAAA